MVDKFLSTLTKTNRSHLFYVDWEKARSYQKYYQDELALLSVLSNATNPTAELRRLLLRYPKINQLLPLLVAVRLKADKNKNYLLTVIDEDKINNIEYNFKINNLTEENINNSINFALKTGLLEQLTKIKNHSDYYFGVEVGSDTNARKNRSGKAMEGMVLDILSDILPKYGGIMLEQKKFDFAAKSFGVTIPPHENNKKGDFMVFINGKPTNIEVNYFDDGGSKQEIMNSYITRSNDLKAAGWGFILVTDGKGWLTNRRQVEEGYKRIGNIFNLQMCASGLLEKTLIGS